jgi:uncharacterized membrane protein YqaE (UPF0057 family)
LAPGGGALGGGGKAAQQHPQQEKPIAQPEQELGAMQDMGQMESSAESPAVVKETSKPKVEIGKNSTEGQSSQELNDAGFAKMATEHARQKETRQQLKLAVKNHREAVKNQAPDAPMDSELLLYVILAILLPPLAVGLYTGGLTTEFWICLILTLLFYLPGLIYALIVILGS